MSDFKRYNFIVVGGGLAGLYTAYHLSHQGSVALITTDTLSMSNSYYAQGGMAAVMDAEDTFEEHFRDTIVAGRGLCDPATVRILTDEASERINELASMGMDFDHTPDGKVLLGLEGGHHHNRILHAGGDATGRMVTTFLIQTVEHTPNITILPGNSLVGLFVTHGVCHGAIVHNTERWANELLLAQAVVLATGGAGALYAPTTNPPKTLGEGLAIAHEAGATLRDMEFIQFHPTAHVEPDGSAFLISEAVRGEGAHLLDSQGRRFMVPIHAQAELAPRDIVARSIFLKMKEEHSDHVYLSTAHIDSAHLLKRFPTIHAYCERVGIDFTRGIDIAPSAHYTVGGVYTNEWGRTDVKGLYAVGEVASTGVMGANRLASNSLIECLVFGKRIADDIRSNIVATATDDNAVTEAARQLVLPALMPRQEEERWEQNEGNPLQESLRKLMMSNVGILRTKDEISVAVKRIHQELSQLNEQGKHMLAARRLAFRFSTALMIARGALEREESRGGHFRTDFPDTLTDDVAYHTLMRHFAVTHAPIDHE